MAERAVAVSADQWARSDSADAGRLGATSRGGRRSAAIARSFSAVGIACGLIAFCLSLMPSLIPRAWLVQAAFSGVSMLLGYAAGVLVHWFARGAGIRPSWSDTTRRRGWLVLAVAGIAAVAGFGVWSVTWQSDLRALLGMPGVEPVFAAVFPVAVAIAFVLVVIGRGVRALTRALSAVVRRRVPRVAVRLGTAALGVVLAVLVLNGTVMTWAVHVLDRGATFLESPERPSAPIALPERSGSPDSLVPWDSLGAQGRLFVSGGPSPDKLADFSDRRSVPPTGVETPIRVYAGPGSADDMDSAAALVVAELDRTEAWDRDVLIVATPTSDGMVAPAAIQTIEMMHAGNTATAAMQYSYVASWLSFITDRNTPPEAGQVLFEAVYARWSELPEWGRPRLLVFGESLGSYGGHGAFSGLQDMVTRTDGALWVATPRFTDVWGDLVRARDPGTLEVDPVFDGGRQVRWGTGSGDATDLWALGEDWEEPRVVYLQHPSDGVVWWSSDLLLHEPDWLREPSGQDVLPGLRWFPVVTYWLTTMDMVIAEEVPVGHGHVYLGEYVDAWAAVAPPAEWTDEDTSALRAVIVETFGAG